MIISPVFCSVFCIFLRLVPPLLQGSKHPDAWEVRPREQMWHPRPPVADGAPPEEEGRRRDPQRVRPLEEEVLRFPLHPHPGEEVSWELLRLQVHAAHVLFSGLLCR